MRALSIAFLVVVAETSAAQPLVIDDFRQEPFALSDSNPAQGGCCPLTQSLTGFPFALRLPFVDYFTGGMPGGGFASLTLPATEAEVTLRMTGIANALGELIYVATPSGSSVDLTDSGRANAIAVLVTAVPVTGGAGGVANLSLEVEDTSGVPITEITPIDGRPTEKGPGGPGYYVFPFASFGNTFGESPPDFSEVTEFRVRVNVGTLSDVVLGGIWAVPAAATAPAISGGGRFALYAGILLAAGLVGLRVTQRGRQQRT